MGLGSRKPAPASDLESQNRFSPGRDTLRSEEGDAKAALGSAVELLRATGHTDEDRPWIPLGVGVHAGNAFVGMLGQHGGSMELTALGDDTNVGARLADAAAVGEILASLQLVQKVRLDTDRLEHRHLDLKGKSEPFEVVVIKPI